jgi:hypothetical protein
VSDLNVGRINFGKARSMSELRMHAVQAPVEAAHEIGRLRSEIERLKQGLWDCAVAAGIDTDGNKTPRHLKSDIVEFALNAVKDLRYDYDNALIEWDEAQGR